MRSSQEKAKQAKFKHMSSGRALLDTTYFLQKTLHTSDTKDWKFKIKKRKLRKKSKNYNTYNASYFNYLNLDHGGMIEKQIELFFLSAIFIELIFLLLH